MCTTLHLSMAVLIPQAVTSLKVISRGAVDKCGSDTEEWVMTSVVIVDGGGNILEYVAGDEEAQQVKSALVQNTPFHIRIAT